MPMRTNGESVRGAVSDPDRSSGSLRPVSAMKIAYCFTHPLPVDYLLGNNDGHFAWFAYASRYYEVALFVPNGQRGTIQRDNYSIVCAENAEKVAEALAAYQPDALVCYGPVEQREWASYLAAAPNAVHALDYGGGPIAKENGEPLAGVERFAHIFTAHETQAQVLRDQGVSASRARGVPLSTFRPMEGVAKQWLVLSPSTFVPGKRLSLIAQTLEEYAPHEPSLFAGWLEHPAVVDMVKCGGIPLNRPGIPQRNNITICGRIPAPVMPLVYNASRVVISASQEEAGPWVVMEALACGTPAIVMADAEWGVADAFREIADDMALQVVDPWPQNIWEAIEVARFVTPEQCRMLAVHHWDWRKMSDTIDRVLKNLVGLKQAGQRLEDVA